MSDTVEFQAYAGDEIEVTVVGRCFGDTKDFDCEIVKVYITTDTQENDILYLLTKLDKEILEADLYEECRDYIENAKMEATEGRRDAALCNGGY